MNVWRLTVWFAFSLAVAGGGVFATRAQSGGAAPLRDLLSRNTAARSRSTVACSSSFPMTARRSRERRRDQYRANSTKPIFGVDVDGLKPGADVDHRRPDRRLAGAQPEGPPARRLLRAGADQPLRDVPSRRRPHDQDADGPRRGAALGPEAGKLLQQAGEDAPRPGERRRDQDLDGSGDSADRAAEGHRRR